MKKSLLLLATAFIGLTAAAAEYVTAGDGTTYSFSSLAGIEGSNVTKEGENTFIVNDDFTVTEGDKFILDQGATVKFADGVRIDLDGTTVLDGGESRTLLTSTSTNAHPKGIWASGPDDLTVKNVDFEYVGLAAHNATFNEITNCTFTKANGKLSSVAALNLAQLGAKYHVANCKFTECTCPAIGAGANILTETTIEDCELFDNNTDNTNKPQINFTVGGDKDVIIRNCTITGTGRDKVGGIAVSNMTVAAGTNRVYVENCRISENRYGITAIGPLYIEIRDNVLLNNNHDSNPMSGGSGISLTGYNYGQDGIISGNHIEGHLWGITLIQCRDINCGEVDNPDSPGLNVFKDNGNNGVAYDLYNNGANTVYAQNNTWSVAEQTEAEIETVIYHKNDDSKLGEVIFMPAHDPDSVEAIEADNSNAPAEYFNLQGIRVDEPVSGLYIRRQGNQATKQIIR
ncbi:MAG: right-handed parallel beta-helix repeat-containing protein [Muribaculaceae bacterium]|nr:right-handed parallel beta-helix repeat-containing protein [Muribaculaceae bacterium]